IIFRYSDKHCSSCIEDYLRTFYKYHLYENLKEDLIILANCDEFRSFKMAQKESEFGFAAFNFNNPFPLEFENSLIPYMMVIDTSFKVHMVTLMDFKDEKALFDYIDYTYNRFF